MPLYGILPVTVPGARVGLAGGAQTLRQADIQGGARARGAVRGETAFRSPSASRTTGSLPNALPLQGMLHRAGSGFDQDLVHERRSRRRPGRFSRIPDLARTLRLLQAQGGDAFYKGEIAAAIVAKSQALGGTMTLEDLAELQGRVGRAGAHPVPWI